jgi:hypothetical protein
MRYVRGEWKPVELTEKAFIPFLWKDAITDGSSLGRAEFEVCIKYKRRHISEFWVYPVQLRMDTFWHYVGGDIDFALSSYEGLEDPKAWLFFWCKLHKTSGFSVYAPPYSQFLEINYHGLSFWKTNPYAKG